MRLVNRRQIDAVKTQEGSPRWCALNFACNEEAGQTKSVTAWKEVKNFTT